MSPAFDKGSRINQYIILEKIHHGGISEVYFADDPKNQRRVALKIFRGENNAPERKAVLLSYIPNLIPLNHSGLAKIHEAFEFEGHFVMVMDFCEGQSLKDMLKGFEATPQKAVELIIQLLDALDYAHQKDLIHGPIAPSQVIVGLDGQAKITDFEELVIYTANNDAWAPLSFRFPEYTAPEILDGTIPDKRSDLFSVGVILYELLAGESPFRGDNRAESSELVKAHTPTALSKIRPGLPRQLDNILQRLLGKDPEHRYQNAAEAASHLKNISFVDGAADVKPPIDWWNRYVVPAAALVLIIIALLWILK